MRFSEHFGIDRSQAELDFVDVPLGTDIRVFVDPYALATTNTPWSIEAHSLASDFFQCVLDRLRAGDRDGAMILLSRLREDNRTRLGYSKNRPQGSGLGDDRAGPFLDAIESSQAFQTGHIEDIEDAALFVDGIGFDIVSDMVTNVLREHLARYTQEQCRLLGVPLNRSETFEAWRVGEGWTTVSMDLPTDGSQSILLVPRSLVRKDLSLGASQYLTDFLDHLPPGGTASLERMLQRPLPRKKRRKIHRQELRDGLTQTESLKRAMAKITSEFPDSLKEYKERARTKRPVLTENDIENVHPEGRMIDRILVANEMRDAAKNADDAMLLASEVASTVLMAMHPLLQHPRRLDSEVTGFAGVVFSNAATAGMFWDARQRGRQSSPNVVLLATPSAITAETLSQIDPRAICAATAAGAVFLVGQEIEESVLGRRKDLVRDGVIVVNVDELADIAELDADPELAVELLEEVLAS